MSMLVLSCAFSTSCSRIGSACWLMKIERLVWFGESGTFTAVIRRVTFLPTVIFLTTSVSWSSPQRSTCAIEPLTVFVTVLATVAGAVAYMAFSFWWSEGEAFDVDPAARHADAAHVALDRARHRRRAAEEDVACGDVGDELAQVVRREDAVSAGRGVVADDGVHLGAELVQLVGEDEVGLVEDAVDDRDLAVQLLDERTNRRDADPARDQHDLVATAHGVGE